MKRQDPVDWLACGAPAPMKPARSYIPSALHAKQLSFIALSHLEAMYGGAAGGGKTEALLADALQYVDKPHFRALLLRRTFKALNLPGSIMHRAIDWIGRDLWHEQEKQFRFPSGAILQFGYCDAEGDLNRYKSAQFHRIYIDEVTEWAEGWYQFLFSRIRRVKGDPIPLGMRTATNPDGIGAEWVRRRYGIPEGAIVDAPIEDAAEDRIFVPARADDNPSLDLESYERALAKLGPARYQQLRHGRWIRDGEGLVYKHFDDARNVAPAPADLKWFVLGMDYGFTDATAFAVLGWRPHDPTVYVVRCWKEKGLIPSDAAARARELEEQYRFARIVGDIGGLGKGYAEEARVRWGIPIEPAEKNNKRGYIDLLNGELMKGALRIARPGADELRKEWLELPWDEARAKESEGFENHCADACLYAWRAATAFQERPEDAKPAPGTREYDEETAAQLRERRRADVQRRAEGTGSFADRWASRPSLRK